MYKQRPCRERGEQTIEAPALSRTGRKQIKYDRKSGNLPRAPSPRQENTNICSPKNEDFPGSIKGRLDPGEKGGGSGRPKKKCLLYLACVATTGFNFLGPRLCISSLRPPGNLRFGDHKLSWWREPSASPRSAARRRAACRASSIRRKWYGAHPRIVSLRFSMHT